MQEESPQIPFNYKDENGNVIFRDALIFTSISDLRNTSKAEREEMMEQRYQTWLQARNTPTNVADSAEEE